MVNISLYKCSCDNKVVNKLPYMTYVSSVTGIFREPANVLSMDLRLDTSNPDFKKDFNYVYVTEFERFYYVASITYERNNIINVKLTIDVLMSYYNGIQTLTGFIERCENPNLANNNIIDTRRVIAQGTKITEKSLTYKNNFFYEGVNRGVYVLNGSLLRYGN